MILEAIKAYWEYQKSDRDPTHIGMSAIGHCGRQLAYMHHGVEGRPLDWRAKVIFDDGHRHHEQIRKALTDGLILLESCYSLVREEDEVSLGVLKGHVDGILYHDHEKCKNIKHNHMLLEVKSMNDRGFQELKKTGKLGIEYMAQTSAYIRAADVEGAIVLAKNKNTGEMYVLEVQENGHLLDERLNVLAEVHNSTTPEEVQREYGPKESGDLPWQCNYCPFTSVCWRHEGVVTQSVHKYVIPTKKCHSKTANAAKKGDKSNGTEVATKESKDDSEAGKDGTT